jgi:hypothetical protein
MGTRESILKAKDEKEVADLGEAAMNFTEASDKTRRRIGLAMTRRLNALRNEAAMKSRKAK